MKTKETMQNVSKRLGRYAPVVAGGILGTPLYVIGSPALVQSGAASGSYRLDSEVRYMMNEFRRKNKKNEPLSMGDGFDMGKALVEYPAHWLGKRFGEMGFRMLPIGMTETDIKSLREEHYEHALKAQ